MNPSIERQLAEAQARIEELTAEIDATNRGIVALHSELEAAREAEARAQAEHEVMAERDRIAQNLHDLVIQRVFGASMALQGVAGLIHQPATAARVKTVIRDLDATIRDLRTTIFGLDDQPQQASSLRAKLLDLATQAHDAQGHTPTINFEGPIDAAIPDHVAADLLAVAGTALSTIARHADTEHTEILVRAGDDLLLRVSTAPNDAIPATALDELHDQAAAYRGTLNLTNTPATGTLLEWRMHLPPRTTPQ